MYNILGKHIQRIVIKTGSSALFKNINNKDGKAIELNTDFLNHLADSVKFLLDNKKDVLIICSGAVATGRMVLGQEFSRNAQGINKRVLAVVGQINLSKYVFEAFAERGVIAGQVLTSTDDCDSRDRYLNLSEVLKLMISQSIVPVINENDATVISARRIGDNDRLSARIAEMVQADLLIILSDVDGLYTNNPNTDKNAKLIHKIEKFEKYLHEIADGADTFGVGTGGMKTKIMAAKMAYDIGCDTIITSHLDNNFLDKIQNTSDYTLFKSNLSFKKNKKQWIANYINTSGQIIVDQNAATALLNKKSLLPAGIKEVVGQFSRGSVVDILNHEKVLIAKGISSYHSHEINRIKGKKTNDIVDILGFTFGDVVVHVDNMSIISES